LKSISREDLSIDKNSEGAWRISAVVDDYLETRRYYGYDQDEAIRRFLEDMQGVDRKLDN
jgi:hypothetical protein